HIGLWSACGADDRRPRGTARSHAGHLPRARLRTLECSSSFVWVYGRQDFLFSFAPLKKYSHPAFLDPKTTRPQNLPPCNTHSGSVILIGAGKRVLLPDLIPARMVLGERMAKNDE